MIAPIFVGCDVSLRQLDICILAGDRPRFLQVPNTAPGRAALVGELACITPERIVLEATAGYERPVIAGLQEAGLSVSRLTPQRLRHFARSSGALAKTDRADAHMLALYGRHMRPEPTPRLDKTHIHLKDLSARRRFLVGRRVAEKAQAARAEHDTLKRWIDDSLAQIQAQIVAIDAEIDRILAADAQATARRRRHLSVPGIGPRIAAGLVVYVPELGQLTRGESAALVGVAPFARDSGRWRGRRVCQGGRKPIRDLLFMAAVSASRMKHTPFGAFYDRMIANGKPKKIALIAVIRKLVVTLNAIERDKTTYSA